MCAGFCIPFGQSSSAQAFSERKDTRHNTPSLAPKLPGQEMPANSISARPVDSNNGAAIVRLKIRVRGSLELSLVVGDCADICQRFQPDPDRDTTGGGQ